MYISYKCLVSTEISLIFTRLLKGTMSMLAVPDLYFFSSQYQWSVSNIQLSSIWIITATDGDFVVVVALFFFYSSVFVSFHFSANFTPNNSNYKQNLIILSAVCKSAVTSTKLVMLLHWLLIWIFLQCVGSIKFTFALCSMTQFFCLHRDFTHLSWVCVVNYSRSTLLLFVALYFCAEESETMIDCLVQSSCTVYHWVSLFSFKLKKTTDCFE